ncbi:MAG: ABC transporter substrate-binding protein [Hyphomicrobiales bacterium]|jgi:microcin C transport system substrate-binding protein
MNLRTPSLILRNVTRRSVLKSTGVVAAATTLPLSAFAQGSVTRSHGLSSFGELALPADYTHFPHVDVDAPKGGMLSYQPGTRFFNQNFLTFNTLNPFVLRGDAPTRLEITFDTLMKGSGDEADALYGLLAQWVEFTDDGLTYDFKIRAEARFHDGAPITAGDAAWSFTTLKEQGHPNLASLLAEMESAEALEEDVVRVRLAPGRPRDLHLSVAGLPVFSQAFFAGREFDAATLDPILGSGPYRVGDLEGGRFIHYDRVADYWGADLPINLGQNNFDRIRVNFYRDRDVAFEAFKAGEMNVREEFTSRVWATEYTFPSVTSGEVVQATYPDDRPSGAQGFYFNTRRSKFADPKVREALGLLFDFEWSNERLFFGLYDRTVSMFQGAPYMASGLPSEAELALLEPFRNDLPESVFGEPYVPPVSDGSGSDRTLQRRANQMLNDAGWTLVDGQRVNAEGVQMQIEFLFSSPVFERIVNPYIQNMQRLGIDATMRTVDGAQYQGRLNEFDFDITTMRLAGTLTPGANLRSVYGSQFADVPGSFNLAGIRVPAVDALIEKAAQAESRDELYTILRAMDRVLRPYHFWVPQWTKAEHWMAHESDIGVPPTKPRYALPIETHWWMEA